MPPKRKYAALQVTATNPTAERRRKAARGRTVLATNGRGYSSTLVPWNPLPFARKAVFKYVEEFQINPAIGVVGDYVFSANGMYDPNITGTGHQPYGFDQMMANYDHYTVTGSKITLRAVNNNSNPSWFLIALRDAADSLTGSTTGEILEQPGVASRQVGYFTSGSSTAILQARFDTAKFFHIKDFVGKSQYRGTSSANPLEQAYFHVILGPNTSSDDLGAQAIWVEIEYTATLTEPKILPSS